MGWNRAALSLAAAALIAASPAPGSDPRTISALHVLVAKDLRVAAIAYRLQTAAVDHCPKHTRLSGLVVQDASQYRADLRPAMAVAFGMGELPTIVAVVPGSAGERAGITPGDAIVRVDDAALADALPAGRAQTPDGARFSAMIDRLDAAFAKGPVVLVLRRAGATRTLTLAGAPACASATQLDLSSARNASADGRTVSITQGIADFARSDDELAFVIAHELSHNILDHRDFLDSAHSFRGRLDGGNVARVRETERQADYLGVYLVAWAGYDPHAASGFWQRMGRADRLGELFADGSHPGIATRVRDLGRAADEIDAQRNAGRPATPDYAAFEASASASASASGAASR